MAFRPIFTTVHASSSTTTLLSAGPDRVPKNDDERAAAELYSNMLQAVHAGCHSLQTIADCSTPRAAPSENSGGTAAPRAVVSHSSHPQQTATAPAGKRAEIHLNHTDTEHTAFCMLERRAYRTPDRTTGRTAGGRQTHDLTGRRDSEPLAAVRPRRIAFKTNSAE